MSRKRREEEEDGTANRLKCQTKVNSRYVFHVIVIIVFGTEHGDESVLSTSRRHAIPSYAIQHFAQNYVPCSRNAPPFTHIFRLFFGASRRELHASIMSK